MERAALRETILNNPQFFARILRFNLPASSAFTPEHLTEQAAELLRSGFLGLLETSPRGAALVRGYLFKNSLPAPIKGEQFFADFQEERRRLALLTPKELQDLTRLFGAGVYAPQIAKTIKRDEVLALRDFLGQAYNYALLRGRFQMGQVRGLFKQTDQPAEGGAAVSLSERIVAAGLDALRVCMADWPQNLQDRLRPALPAPALKRILPQTSVFSWPERIEKKPENLQSTWLSLKKILLQELTPECHPCFA
ncbi:MAG: hypothetical protein LBV76_03520 [Deltaproteobacteria bacterium]|nr:hypothetical protein [Deltaproteobacteria bacterium]